VLIRATTIFAGYYNDEAHARGARRRTAGCRPATSRRSTRTASSRSPTARRTSSSPPAARTSRPQNLENALRTRSTSRRRSSSATAVPSSRALVTLDDAAVSADGLDPQESSSRGSSTRSTAHSHAYEQIKRFTILPRDFSVDEGEITPTLKLKRRVIEDHFAGEIEKLYER
jgi:hypothetical protein